MPCQISYCLKMQLAIQLLLKIQMLDAVAVEAALKFYYLATTMNVRSMQVIDTFMTVYHDLINKFYIACNKKCLKYR